MASKYRKPRVIQSVLIKKKYYPTRREASAIVKRMGGQISQFEEDETFWRYRQHEPELFQKSTFRHWHLAKGVRAIVALPIPGVFDL